MKIVRSASVFLTARLLLMYSLTTGTVRGSRTTIGLRLQLVWIVSLAFYKVVGHSHKNGVVPKNTAFLYTRCILLLHKIHNKENFTQVYLLLQ